MSRVKATVKVQIYAIQHHLNAKVYLQSTDGRLIIGYSRRELSIIAPQDYSVVEFELLELELDMLHFGEASYEQS